MFTLQALLPVEQSAWPKLKFIQSDRYDKQFDKEIEKERMFEISTFKFLFMVVILPYQLGW